MFTHTARRGRWVFLAFSLGLGAILALMTLLSGDPAAAGGLLLPIREETLPAQPGDSLPALASRAPALLPAALYTVTELDDPPNIACSPTYCTLRGAISYANAHRDELDTIVLGAGTYSLTLIGADEEYAQSGDLDVTDPLTIVGQGPGLTVIDASRLGDRVFDVQGETGRVVISGVTVYGGSALAGSGGGIFNETAELALINTLVYSNAAEIGGGVSLYSGTLRLDNARIVGNRAKWGGGIHTEYGRVGSVGGRILSNTAEYGGGVYVLHNRAVFTQAGASSLIAYNRATTDGGGVKVEDGRASLNGGRIVYNTAGNFGGGVFVNYGIANLVGVRVLSNTAGVDGGGLYQADINGTATIISACLVNNTDTSLACVEGASLPAVGNWWGAASGPSGAGPGSGDSVSTGVDFSRYLSSAPPGCPMGPNTPPAARPDLAATKPGVSLTIDVLANDADFDGDSLSIATVGVANHGGDISISISRLYLTYTPLPAFHGVEMFTYTVSDGRGGSGTAPVEVRVSAASTTVSPSQPASLVVTDTQGRLLSVELPAGAVTQTMGLLYNPIVAPESPFSTLGLAGIAFSLEAYRDGQPIAGLSFQLPITLTLVYTDSDVSGIDESSLAVYYYDWGSSRWLDDGIAVVGRDAANNRLVATVAHLSDMALLGAANSPPQISGTPPPEAQVGQLYSFTPVASDAEGGTLSFSVQNKPAWASFNSGTGQLSGTPGSSDVGHTLGIVIGVSDGQASASLPAFDLVVSDPASPLQPASLIFHMVEGDPIPGPQTIALRYDAPEYYFPSSYPEASGAAWLNTLNSPVYPASFDPTPVYIQFIFSLNAPVVQALPGGTYNAQVSVALGSMGGASPRTIELPASLVIAASGEIQVDRSQLQYGFVRGHTSPAAQALQISSSGSKPLTWTASADRAWVGLGATLGQTPATLNVSVNPAGLAAGLHSALLNVTDGAKSVQVRVYLNVVDEGGEAIELNALEVTQGVQNLLNDVRLAANRPTYVRAHVRSRGSQAVENVTARLIGWRAGSPIGQIGPVNDGNAVDVLPSPSRAARDDSFLFHLPELWLTGVLSLTFEGVSHPIACREHNDIPNDCCLMANFEPAPALPIQFVYANGATDNQRDCALRAINSLLPVPELAVSVSPATLNYEGTRNNTLVLEDLTRLWQEAGSPNMHYFGLFPYVSGSASGLAYIPGSTAMGDYADWAPTIVPHELAHNLGLGHAPCGVSDADPNYPYPEARISGQLDGVEAFYGFDIYDGTIYGPETKDLMSYCQPAWVSGWSSNKFLDALKARYGSAHRAQAGVTAAAGSELSFVSGRVRSAQNASIDSVWGIVAQGDIPAPAPGEYGLRFEDGQGQAVVTTSFGLSRASDQGFVPQTSHDAFSLLVPHRLDGSSPVKRIALVRQGVELYSLNGSETAPAFVGRGQVAYFAPTSTVSVRWTAHDGDGDPLQYRLEYSRDGGNVWHQVAAGSSESGSPSRVDLELAQLPGSDAPRWRVSINDGFYTVITDALDSVTPFTVPNKSPKATILTIDDTSYAGDQLIMLAGYGFDLEDGRLSGDALEWRSGGERLGTGERLAIAASRLAPGQHLINLVATDSDGNRSLVSDAGIITPPVPAQARVASAPAQAVEATMGIAGETCGTNPLLLTTYAEAPSRPPQLSVSPARLDVTLIVSGEATSSFTRSLALRNGGDGGDIAWSVSRSGAAILTPTLAGGTTPASLVVSIDAGVSLAGEHAGVLTFQSNSSAITTVQVPYRLWVLDLSTFTHWIYLPLVVKQGP
ncbi:MAG: cadherin-like domain-containing protein [Thermoflexales bacterium]|nr:cadherin-like domain-containing protein [Thermoflexales bacterium]